MMKRIHVEVSNRARIHAEATVVCPAAEVPQRIVRAVADGMRSVDVSPEYCYELQSAGTQRLELRVVVMLADIPL